MPDDAVYYLSHQNSNLTEEMSPLLGSITDIERRLRFAREAFGAPPDATNIWLGPDDAVTSLHKVIQILLEPLLLFAPSHTHTHTHTHTQI